MKAWLTLIATATQVKYISYWWKNSSVFIITAFKKSRFRYFKWKPNNSQQETTHWKEKVTFGSGREKFHNLCNSRNVSWRPRTGYNYWTSKQSWAVECSKTKLLTTLFWSKIRVLMNEISASTQARRTDGAVRKLRLPQTIDLI